MEIHTWKTIIGHEFYTKTIINILGMENGIHIQKIKNHGLPMTKIHIRVMSIDNSYTKFEYHGFYTKCNDYYYGQWTPTDWNSLQEKHAVKGCHERSNSRYSDFTKSDFTIHIEYKLRLTIKIHDARMQRIQIR